MYWPTKVNANGALVKHNSGNKNKGVKVNAMCTNAAPIANFIHLLANNMIPMSTSQPANNTMANLGVKNERNKWSMVFCAKPSAGLADGKNLSIPNHIYTSANAKRMNANIREVLGNIGFKYITNNC
jgi:hypothetical protein